MRLIFGVETPSMKPNSWSVRTEALLLAVITWCCYIAIEVGIHPGNWAIASMWASHGLLLTLVLMSILLLTRRWPVLVRLPLGLLAAVTLGLAQAHIDILSGEWFLGGGPETGTSPMFVLITGDGVRDMRLSVNIAVYLWMFGFYAAAVTLMLFRRAAFDARYAAQAARLEALRLQLAPHFLFNALNSISTLIMIGRTEQADEMTQRLSAFFRSTLLNSGSDAVTLWDELETVGDYLDVERIRFEDRLDIDIRCPDEVAGALVPGLILQPLVENVIKHAVSLTDRPVTLTVTAARDAGLLRITVEDDFTGKPAGQAVSSGVGTQNVRNRLKTLYGEAASLETGSSSTGYRSVLVLPFVDGIGPASDRRTPTA